MIRVSVAALLGLTFGLALLTPIAEAAPATSIWYPNKLNISSDDSAEFLINLAGPSATLDVGDVLVAIASMNNNRNAEDGLASVAYNTTGNELTFVSLVQVTGKVAGSTLGRFDFTFGAVTAASKAAILLDASLAIVSAEVATWGADTVIAVYDDATPNFTQGFTALGPAPDDGDLDGALTPLHDTGVGPFLDESAGFLTANDGTKIMEIGFAALPGTTTYWVADESLDDVSLFRLLPSISAGGLFNAGLNLIPGTNLTGFDFGLVPNFNPLTSTLGVSNFNASGSLLGKLGSDSPHDLFDNVDIAFRPLAAVPEPTGFTLLSLGAIVAVGGFRLRRRLAST